MSNVVYAARNHLHAVISYDGVERLVEPYSLRRRKTGNLLLYVYEVQRGDRATGQIKALKVSEIQSASVSGQAFTPRYAVEL